jgi:shikimate dehydrogenase
MTAAKAMQVCGSLSRYPVSLGRVMHEAGYRALELPFVYVPFRCTHLEHALFGMRALNIRGFGISMPFKMEILPFLDQIDPMAAEIGAVNTVVNNDGELCGYNTDAQGGVEALREVISLPQRRVLLLGAGGAARALAYGLKAAGVHLTICNRTHAKALELQTSLGAQVQVVPYEERDQLQDFDVLVNASSFGMSDVDPRCPVAAGSLHSGLVVLDAVYKPVETELIRWARQRCASAIDGSRMLLFQAMGQFSLYTKQPAPRVAMEQALLESLATSEIRRR